MGGRFRALLVAVASSGSLLFAWLGAATVALVVLRHGYREGLWVLLWASLPALLLTQLTGDSSVLVLLVGTAALSVVLHATASLTLAAVASAGVAVLTGLALLAFGQSLLAELAQVLGTFFESLEKQALEAGSGPIVLLRPTPVQLAGMMGAANGALSFLCLALARYWQAALYNPGGFGAEFRDLRLPPVWVGLLSVAALALAMGGLSYRSWAASLLLPLTMGGFALLHARARHRGQGSFWLTGMYLVWLLFDAAKLALVGLVIGDAVMNFRRRWDSSKNGDDNG
ncbi:MAG: hypothetical protein ACI87W_002611 [Halieaceae bacterium]|jgi:hypothetical protein